MNNNTQKKSLNILLSSSSFPLSSTEIVGSFIYEYCKCIQQFYQHQITVLAPHKKGALKHEICLSIPTCRYQYLFPDNLEKVAYFGGIPNNVKSSMMARIGLPFFLLSQFLHLAFLLHTKKYDILHTEWLLPQGLIGALCKQLFPTRMKHIVTIHSSEVTFLVKYVPKAYLIVEYIFRYSDAIISVSQHRADELMGLLPEDKRAACANKLSIIPMGTSLDTLPSSSHSRNLISLKKRLGVKTPHVVLCVGRFIEVKGFLYVLNAFKCLLRTRNDVSLLLVGSGPLEKQFRDFIVDNNLENNIILPGLIQHDNIGAYYKIADMLVFSSIVDDDGYQEGLPVVLIEALTYGIPIIATETNGVLEVIRDGYNGIIIPQKTSSRIVEAINILLNSEDLKTKLHINAIASSKKYDWKTVVMKNNDLYFKVLESD